MQHSRPNIQCMPMHFNQYLNMRQITVKFVSCLLNDDQKQNRLSVSQYLQDQARNGRNFFCGLSVPKNENSFQGTAIQGYLEIQVELHWCWTASWNGIFNDAFSSGRSARPSVQTQKERVLCLNYFTSTVRKILIGTLYVLYPWS